MQEGEDSSCSSLCLPACWQCNRNSEKYFECSRSGCPGPASQTEGARRNRIALCCRCVEGGCPFCKDSIQKEDLRSVTDRPATLVTCSVEEGDAKRLTEDDAATSHVQHNHRTLEQFNKHFEELANKVQEKYRKLRKDSAETAPSSHTEIVRLVEEAKTLIHSLTEQRLRPDRVTYHWIISLYARAKDRDQVDWWAEQMERSGNCSTEAYNAAMFGFAGPQCMDRADMWFNRMVAKGVKPDVKSYTILIQAAAASRDSARANLYFKRMRENAVQPNEWTFGHLISTCAHEVPNPRSLQRAEEYWKIMQEAGVKPNHFTFMQVLRVCAHVGDARRALHFFNQSVEKGFPPDVFTYTKMISVFIPHGDVRAAEKWFSNMQAAGVTPNIAAFSCVMRVCGTAGDVQSARKWLATLEAGGLQATQHTYEALVIAELKRKDFAQADVWLHRMLDSGVRKTVSIFLILLEACESTGNLSQAEKWFQTMIDAAVQPDVNAMNSMLRTCAVYDSSGWLRLRRPACLEQKRWFLKMFALNVQPDEVTHDILTRSASSWPKSDTLLVIAAVVSLCFLLRRKLAAS